MRTGVDSLQSLTDFIFCNLDTNYKDSKWLSERAILCPTNAEAEEVNNIIIDKWKGTKTTFKSVDDTEEGGPDYTPEYLNTLPLPGIAPHLLHLKIGAPVVLLRNMNQASGHCNGTKYVITNIRKHVLELRAISGTNIGSILLLPRIIMISQSSVL